MKVEVCLSLAVFVTFTAFSSWDFNKAIHSHLKTKYHMNDLGTYSRFEACMMFHRDNNGTLYSFRIQSAKRRCLPLDFIIYSSEFFNSKSFAGSKNGH